MSDILVQANRLSKTFTLHLQAGTQLDVLRDTSLTVRAGTCVALAGPSGTGKSTLLRSLYGNYLIDEGEILVRHEGRMIDLTKAPPAEVIEIRRTTLGYVSQFLRAIPRVTALDVVAGALTDRGVALTRARLQAAKMLERLGIGPRLHGLPPATFSGGEQQRVNLARAFVCDWPIMLLDEPTASLDNANRDIVIELMREAKARGSALVGIFHDAFVREAIADNVLALEPVSKMRDVSMAALKDEEVA
jgi:alpha-D-ribose 1-methylphosphonate 5-triphosphate synthase subunit PhnL